MLLTPSASFTRPADTTAYASGDLVANSTTAGSVTPLTFTMPAQSRDGINFIRRVRLKKSGNTTSNASFRIHFYKTDPTASAPTNGDNGAWATVEAGYLGSCDVTIDKVFIDSSGPAAGIGVPNAGNEINFVVSSGSDKQTLYALVEARAAYGPASAEVFTVTPEIYSA